MDPIQFLVGSQVSRNQVMLVFCTQSNLACLFVSLYPFPLVAYPFPLVAYPFPLVAYPFPLVAYPIPLVVYPFPLVGYPFPLVVCFLCVRAETHSVTPSRRTVTK
ncbi:hypothetical protein J3F83DRAFT_736052 [Trichoderma novae-zelandiae]